MLQSSLHKKGSYILRIFFSKCDQIHRKLQIWPHLLKISLMENLILCAVVAAVAVTCYRNLYKYTSFAKLNSYCVVFKSSIIFCESLDFLGKIKNFLEI